MARWLLALGALLAAGAWPARAEAPLCQLDAGHRCALLGYGHNEYTYAVDGLNLLLEFTDGGYFALKCPENLTLDNPALPRFQSQLRVNKVQLLNCPSPPYSYADVLDALNVQVLDRLKLWNAGNVTHVQLTNLSTVRTLELVNVQLAPDSLAALTGLRRLFLDGVRLPPAELRQLPRELQLLDLTRMNTDVPADLLDALPALVNVSVRDTHNVSVALGRHLEVLALDLPAAHVPSALPPKLHSLTVFGWDELRPAPWTACALHTLSVRDVTAEELPEGWVSACAQLRVLRVQYGAQLRKLHGPVLRGAAQLQELHVTWCALTSLPMGLLDDAVKLSVLDLTGNLLQVLSGGLFVKTRSLQTLVLAHNKLSTSVYSSLKDVTSLAQLDLSYNQLSDSCGGARDTVRGVSPLERLNKLTYLNLRKTNTSLICRDWRDSMPLLEKLDLSANDFTSVTYADLQFPVTKDVKVILTNNNVTQLLYTQNDYKKTLLGEKSHADVVLGSALACDCDAYWAARALRERPEHVRVSAACARQALRDVPLEQLQCGAPALCARTRCACAWARTGAAPARALHVRCERAGLARLHDVTAPLRTALRRARQAPDDYDWRLYLAHNHIFELDAADIPNHLSVLDLSNNSLSTLSADVTRALLADSRRHVLLAGNPLDCNCSAADTVRALKAQQQVLQDYARVTCSNGSLLDTAATRDCDTPRGLNAGVAAAGAALLTLLVAAALAALLRHPAARRRLKQVLRGRGLLPAEDDAARRYDVFLSFSHGDERFVRDELVPRLEAPPAPLRLCLHYRDWAPGGWIPAQIAASVRASRRTVAVVSAHFLRSAWARAEFQEAYALALRDACPRLVVVLLDDPAALPLDARLRRYLETNTYVRWGDPFFWQKLRRALPCSRGPAPPGPQGPVPAEPAPPCPQGPALPVPAEPAPFDPQGPALPLPAEPAPQGPVPAEPAAGIDSSSELSMASLNSATSSTCSSSATCSSSPAGSALELDRLAPSCAALAGGLAARAPACAALAGGLAARAPACAVRV